MQISLKKNLNKIGILGGTFDPPHIGHLYISKIALKKLKLKKLIWIITKKNPLKQKPYLSIKTRIPPAKIPDVIIGIVILKIVYHILNPKLLDASSI